MIGKSPIPSDPPFLNLKCGIYMVTLYMTFIKIVHKSGGPLVRQHPTETDGNTYLSSPSSKTTSQRRRDPCELTHTQLWSLSAGHISDYLLPLPSLSCVFACCFFLFSVFVDGPLSHLWGALTLLCSVLLCFCVCLFVCLLVFVSCFASFASFFRSTT